MAATVVSKELLIESVKKYPCLYDTSRKDYRDDSVRESAWRMVCGDVLSQVHEDRKLLIEGKQDYQVCCHAGSRQDLDLFLSRSCKLLLEV